MLKWKVNETLTWTIDWINKEFVSANYIAKVGSVVVDWTALTSAQYTIDRYTILLVSAPTVSITMNHFYREELDIIWEGLVEFGDITREVYEELWRNELSRVYVKSRVEEMINKSLKRITNKSSEKKSVQHYALEGVNWMTITSLSDTSLSGGNIQGVDVAGAMLAGDSVYIPYTGFDGTSFTTDPGLDSVLKVGDKVVVWHRIPYWVQKPTSILIDWTPVQFVDNQLFTIDSENVWTIIRGKDGNEYIFLPYSETAYTLVVKYVPDRKFLVNESDVVDIPYEYTTTIVYDVLYRLLLSREDERMQGYKTMLYWDRQEPGLLKEYRTYIKEQIKKTRGVIRNFINRNQY